MRGDASARLLPFPSVSFSGVEVAGPPGAPPLVTAKRFEMDAELAPYLSGEIRIFSMRLEDPVVSVAVDAEGRFGLAPGSGALPSSATVVLEEVAVSNGTVRVTDAVANRTFVLDDLNGTFAAQSLVGPATGGGTLRVGDRPLTFQLATSEVSAEAGLPLRLTIGDDALSVSAVLDGQARIEDGSPKFEGRLRAETVLPTANETGNGARSPVPAAALPRFDLTSDVRADLATIDLDDLRLAVGGNDAPYVVNGSGRLAGGAAPGFVLTLAGEQVDIDAIAAGGDGESRATTFAERLEAGRAVLAAIPTPPLPGRVTMTLPVVVAGDTTIRDLRIEAEPGSPGWAVRRLTAELPGRTRLEAAGRLEVDPAPGFRGTLLVASRQPSGFSEWLTGAVDPAVRTLTRAGFSATVDLSPASQVFDDLELDIGGETLTGSLKRSGSENARQIAAALRGKRLDLDALVALSRLFTGEADSIAQARRGSLAVAAGPVSFRGATADWIDADLSFDGKTLRIARAEVQGLAGSDISANGTLADLDGADVSGRIETRLRAADPASVAAFLTERLPPSPALDILTQRASRLGPLDLAGTLQTTPGAAGERPTLDVEVNGKAAQTRVALAMLFGNGIHASGEAGRFGLSLSLANEEPVELLGQLGLDALPLPVPQPLTLDLTLSAGATGPVAASAAVRAPGTEVTAEGTFGVSADGVDAADIALSGRSDDLAPWLVATGSGLGIAPTDALPAVLGGTLRYDGDVLQLAGLDGSVGPVDVTGNLAKSGDGPATGAVFASEISLPWLATLAFGRAPTNPSSSGSFDAEIFGESLIPGFGRLAVDVTTDRLDLGGGAIVGEASARLEAGSGSVSLENLRGSVAGGTGTGSVAFRNAGGVGSFTAAVDVRSLDLGRMASSGLALPTEDGATDEAGTPPDVTGTLDANIRLDATGQSFAALAAGLTGAGRVAVGNAAFTGVAPSLFPDVLRAADAEGFEATQSRVSELVRTLIAGKSYPVPSAATEFSVVGGVARFPVVRAERAAESLTAEGQLDLESEAVAGNLRLDLDPGNEAVEGASPSVTFVLGGTLAAPTLEPDVQLLANYLSVRALEREEARVAAIQGALQEKLRLRREVRLRDWRERERLAAAATARETEERRLRQTLRRAEAAREAREGAAVRAATEAAEAERERDRQRAAERDAAERARTTERERVRRRAEQRTNGDDPPPSFDASRFDVTPPSATPPAPASDTLPGVRNPFDLGPR